ncbi:YecA family protein [Bradyrhizobium glycinis]|uniref:YecA family protein n=1 Tax=Bradyrhizobium glycinis TaxID=2751812 RepID=UPI0018D7F7D1|nr:SEC-C domain-containing protein [Bradyrhizobium glycinis]MBH5373064.1 SEC-C domain-containing protein [Bradyrhizobium glycinis]
MKVGRNKPCPCGSGRRYKHCHGSLAPPLSTRGVARIDQAEITRQLDRVRAQEKIRQDQQGFGRPIVGVKHGEHQIVAVGNTIYFSDKWKTFPDFLSDYMKQKLGVEWGNDEIKKPLKDRHQILQWYDYYCRYQQETIKSPGEVSQARVTGVVACYLGLAYSLYLLDHNVELQSRLVKRLKDRSNFQGAFYELFVANILIRAGFTLTLEQEEDGANKHCEFAAVSRRTGTRYWVEAKARSVVGVLGKTDKDGGPDADPLTRLIPHLNQALAKPAADERLIFIDLNTTPQFDSNQKPTWHDRAVSRLERYEDKELAEGKTAYVFVTNIGFHRQLDDVPAPVAVPFGLGISDFNKPGYFRLSEVYRQRKRHADAFEIGEMFLKCLVFPSSFDGRLVSGSKRILIGETYFFENAVPGGLLATVSSVHVSEADGKIYIGTDKGHVLSEAMSEAQFAEYKAHPDAYFGKIVSVNAPVKDAYELFEFFMRAYKDISRDDLISRLAGALNTEQIEKLNDDELLAEYCEQLVFAVQTHR